MAGKLAHTRTVREDDLETVTSFADGPMPAKPVSKYTWTSDTQARAH
jgi:hypothetical protein